MRERAVFTSETGSDGALDVVLSGPLVVSSIGFLDPQLRAISGPVGRLDLSGITAIDTVGAWSVSRLAEDHGATIVGADDRARRLIAAVRGKHGDEDDAAVEPPRPSLGALAERTGTFVTGYFHGMAGLLGFLGALIVATGSVLRHPARFRWTSLVRQLELVGVGALPIIGLMSFLIGIVIAQQGAVQLRQFGAEIYTVNLTGRLSLRELGILMTAIMEIGRASCRERV